jgi:UDP-4-amino-4,6-dideoxy-N-acetyl-beta-L-altrosamine N-acetyltransferase
MLKRWIYTLRHVEEKDLGTLLSWRNSHRIRANMFTDHVITVEEHRAWFNRLKLEQQSYALVYEIGNKPVGLVNINRIDRSNGTCYWGFYIGDTDSGRGNGGRMGLLGLEYIFVILGLVKVTGEAIACNSSSIAFHTKLGFSRNVDPVGHILKNGKSEDIISFTLFRSDWLANKSALEIKYFTDEVKQ